MGCVQVFCHTCLQDLLLSLFCESHVYICLTFSPKAACVSTWICGLLQGTSSHYLLADCNLHFKPHWQQTQGPHPCLSALFPFVVWLIPVPFLPSYFAFILLPVAVVMILLALLHSFTHMPWNLLLPFCIYSPSLKALLLHSLTTRICQASCFITLQSFHLYHLGPHAPSLAGPLHLLSVHFLGCSHQILISLSYLCSTFNHFCLLFFLLHFISCASLSLDSAHSTAHTSFSPSQVSHQSISFI